MINFYLTNKIHYLSCVFFAVFSCNIFSQFKGQKEYDVAAIVWPSYHPDDRAKIFWPDGIGEWQTVISNRPKFKGHQQPRFPLWGYINQSDPYVAEMEIKAATDHGVNVFIFDWYWYDGMPYLEGHLNDGFLKARNNHKMQFYLMWANHDVSRAWDKRGADDVFNQIDKSIIWNGAISRDEFEKICKRFIIKYFSKPNYYKINNKPVFMIYSLNDFIEGLGGVDQSIDAIHWFRNEVKNYGFDGLELQYSLRLDGQRDINVNNQKIIREKKIIEDFGFDSLTHYVYAHMTNVDRDYIEVLNDVENIWKWVSENYKATYFPQVSVGWDTSPRAKKFTGSITKNSTPENFEIALRKAKKFLDLRPNQQQLIVINSWNEWTETSYLMPCDVYGYKYLETLKKIFVENN